MTMATREHTRLAWYIWIDVMRVHRPCRMMSTVPLIEGSLLVNGAATLASPILDGRKRQERVRVRVYTC